MRIRLPARLAVALLVACGGGVAPSAAPSSPTNVVPSATAPVPSIAPVASTSAAPSASASAALAPPVLASKDAPLPAGTGDASFDFILYEPAHDRVWIPYTRDAGYVDVYDVAKGDFTHLTGFKSVEVENKGKKRRMGPSSAAVGDGVVYVGARSKDVCAVDAATLKLGKCITLAAAPDCIGYVPSTKEVWATTPKNGSIVVLDASKPGVLKQKAEIKVDGAPEGWALDDANGFFYTNLEDKDRTLRIDVTTRKVTATWQTGCGQEGPRCLRVDGARGLAMVACTDHVNVLDTNKDGALRAKVETGAGVDDLEYVAATKLLYVAAGKDAKLTVTRIDDDGPKLVATATTAPRARNAVVDAKGNVYMIEPTTPKLMIFSAP